MRPLKLEQLEEGIIRLSHNKGGILGTKFHYVKPTGPYVAPIQQKALRYQDMLDRAYTRTAAKQGIDTSKLSFPGDPDHEKYQKFYSRVGRIQDKISKKKRGGGDIGPAVRLGDVKARRQHEKWSNIIRRNRSLPKRIVKGLGAAGSAFMQNVRKPEPLDT